jgi:hypothetical protein
VVEAAVLVRALDRDHVGGLLDHADRRLVAAGSEQIRQSGPSARLKQRSQSPTFSFTSRIAVASPSASSSGRAGCGRRAAGAVRLADPRQPASSATRRASGAGPSLLTFPGGAAEAAR